MFFKYYLIKIYQMNQHNIKYWKGLLIVPVLVLIFIVAKGTAHFSSELIPHLWDCFSYLPILFYQHADFPVRSLAVQCCLLSQCWIGDKRVHFWWKWTKGQGCQPVADCDSRMFNKCVTFLCGGMEAMGGFGGTGDAMCAYPLLPSDPGPRCLFTLCTRVWNWFLCCDYISEKVDDDSSMCGVYGGSLHDHSPSLFVQQQWSVAPESRTRLKKYKLNYAFMLF